MADRYQPDLLNQFTRLIPRTDRTYDVGSRWNNVVRLTPYSHNFDAENCMATLGAVAADAHTAGKRHLSPGQIRNAQTDFLGGIGIDDVQDAFARLHIPAFNEPSACDFGESIGCMRQGRFVWWAVDYSLVPYQFQAQKGGRFMHAMGGCNVRSDGTFDLYDSLARQIVRVPQYAVKAAAESVAVRERHTRSQLFVGVTNVMPLLTADTTVFRYGGIKRGLGRWLSRVNGVLVYDQPSFSKGKVVGRLEKRHSFASAQTTDKGESFRGSRTWRGTKDGRKWVQAEYLWFAGHTDGTEDIRA